MFVQHTEVFLIELDGRACAVWRGLRTTLEAPLGFFSPYRRLRQRIDALETQNQQLSAQLLEVLPLKPLYGALAEKLTLISPTNWQKFCTAWLLTTPLNTGNKMFLVAAGSKEGVRKGQPVVCSDGLVGRIDQVSAHFARVMPLTHQNFRVPVYGRTSHLQGILAGNGSPTLSLRFQKESGEGVPEEVWLTSSIGGGFPPGLVVGQAPLAEHPQGPQVSPLIPWARLDFVHILLEGSPPSFNEMLEDTPPPSPLLKKPLS